MKIKIIKPHPFYKTGIVEVEEGRGKYLIAMGIAEETGKSEEKHETKEKKEKTEPVHHKEKIQLKPGQLPTGKGSDVTMANIKKAK